MKALINKIGIFGVLGFITICLVAFFLINSKKAHNQNNAYIANDDPSLIVENLPPRRHKIVDMHEHAKTVADAERLLAAMDKFGIRRTCLMASSIYTFTLNNKYGFEGFKENNEELIRIKKRWPDRYCAFVTLDPSQSGNLELLKKYAKKGADGLKLYLGHGAETGKGPFHMMPLDDLRMQPIWTWAEKTQFPIVMHVNLIKYWDEFLRVMEAHPFLRISIPHLGLHKNTAVRLERLGWLLNRYPNLYTDISFGFHTFHKDGFETLAKWRSRSKQFLTEHAHKIFYASDMVLEPTKDDVYIDNTLRSYMQLLEMKSFRFFLAPGFPMHGLELEDDALRKIYEEAPAHFLGEKGDNAVGLPVLPKPISEDSPPH